MKDRHIMKNGHMTRMVIHKEIKKCKQRGEEGTWKGQ
jgi:hypothetical protein